MVEKGNSGYLVEKSVEKFSSQLNMFDLVDVGHDVCRYVFYTPLWSTAYAINQFKPNILVRVFAEPA